MSGNAKEIDFVEWNLPYGLYKFSVKAWISLKTFPACIIYVPFTQCKQFIFLSFLISKSNPLLVFCFVFCYMQRS